MKKLIILITLLVVTLPQHSFAEEEVPALSGAEVIWESEQIPYLHGVLVAPQGELLYNINGKTLEIRRISDGVKIDSIVIENVPNYLYQMSITDDGRYMAFSGDNPYVIIYDLQERKEVKRITTVAYEREEYLEKVVYYTDEWISSSISPDGTKITGIATATDRTMTNFVVIDIASEEVLFEQRRITYNHFNPEEHFHKWHSTEFSPDGNYIVNQLEYRGENHPNSADSVYIYDANTFEVNDILTNRFSKENPLLQFSDLNSQFSYGNTFLYVYNINNKTIINTDIPANVYSLVFSRHSNKFIYGRGFNNFIYDFDNKNRIYEYEKLAVPKCMTLDNNRLISTLNGVIYCLNTYWVKSSIENNENEIIISPNPTNGLVNITLDCQSPHISYQINNTSGQNLESKEIANINNSLVLNFINYPVGIYYLTIECNSNTNTYKIVKEN